jgi:hypothetical protein
MALSASNLAPFGSAENILTVLKRSPLLSVTGACLQGLDEQDEPTAAQFGGLYGAAVDWQPASTPIAVPATSNIVSL